MVYIDTIVLDSVVVMLPPKGHKANQTELGQAVMQENKGKLLKIRMMMMMMMTIILYVWLSSRSR